MHPSIMWLIAGLALLIVELFTGTMFLAWIGLGALLTALLAIWVDPVWAQWLTFTVSSVALLFATRPLARSIHGRVTVPSNVDALIGQEAVVLETIDPDANTGRVRIGSDEWRARGSEHIPQGERVLVMGVEGTTLQVKTKPSA